MNLIRKELEKDFALLDMIRNGCAANRNPVAREVPQTEMERRIVLSSIPAPIHLELI